MSEESRWIPFDATLDAPPSWDASPIGRCTGAGVTVALIDSGIGRCLRGRRVLAGASVEIDSRSLEIRVTAGQCEDRIGHGTACASVLLQGASGAAILPVKVFQKQLLSPSRAVAAGVRWAIESNADVICLSLGTRELELAAELRDACEAANARGVLVVAAGLDRTATMPADLDVCLGVLSGARGGRLNFVVPRDDRKKILGNGSRQVVRWWDGSAVVRAGSSLAAANVAAVVARVCEWTRPSSASALRCSLKAIAVDS